MGTGRHWSLRIGRQSKMDDGIKKGADHYEDAMRLHYADVAACYCRKCVRTFPTTSRLREHYQSDAHRKRAAKTAKK